MIAVKMYEIRVVRGAALVKQGQAMASLTRGPRPLGIPILPPADVDSQPQISPPSGFRDPIKSKGSFGREIFGHADT